jgi:ABC-type multidrug transport system fused ATPase/permease subunit
VNADSILCVKDGQVVESGTHNELMGKGGVYSSLVSKQVEALDMANNSISNGGEKP